MIVETKLAQAARHVAEGRRIVAKQRELIASEQQAGRDTTLAAGLLSEFERTLARFEADLRALQEESD